MTAGQAPPPVFPAPRRVDLTDGDGSLRTVGVAEDPTLPPQGYRLRIATGGTSIEHRDELGLRYARDTLDQLASADPVGIGTVEDWPTFTDRGFMLDISRDRVPTMETLEWLIGMLGRLRYTELQLYTEHTFAWKGFEEVWHDASPLTADELGHLAARCRDAGLQLVPCLNGFGHMERFLRHDRHRHRAECPDGAPALVGGGTVAPTTLAPTPENAALALSLFREVLRALPSRRVHVGGDEPFELGYGRSAGEVARRGRTAVYVEHMARIVQPLVDDGYEVLFWGDMLARSPDAAASMPRGSTAVAWWYLPPVDDPPPTAAVLGDELAERLGWPDDALAGFAAHARAFADTGFPFWVAPGTSSWNSLVGRWPTARANIDDAVAVGAERGARGVLLTDWGDNGHHQPLACSLPALAHAAGATWCAAGHRPDAIAGVVDDLLGDAGAGERLVALASVEAGLGVRQFNGGAMHAALLGGLLPPERHRLDADRVAAAAAVLDTAAAWRAGAPGSRLDIVTEEVRAAAALARVGLVRLGAALDVEVPPAPTDLESAREQQRRAWLRSSRPGGLDDSLGRLGG